MTLTAPSSLRQFTRDSFHPYNQCTIKTILLLLFLGDILHDVALNQIKESKQIFLLLCCYDTKYSDVPPLPNFSQLFLLCLSKGLGNLGLQNFHQRTLSAASSATAKITCFAAAFIVPTLGIPPILLGAVAASTSMVQEQRIKLH